MDQHFHSKPPHQNSQRMEVVLPTLCAIHYKCAARVARQAQVLELAAKKMVALQRQLEAEAAAGRGRGVHAVVRRRVRRVWVDGGAAGGGREGTRR